MTTAEAPTPLHAVEDIPAESEFSPVERKKQDKGNAELWEEMKGYAQWFTENKYIEPLGERLVVLRAPPRVFFGEHSLIAAPEETQEAPYEGWVIALPPTPLRQPVALMDYMTFSRWAGIDGPRIEEGFHVIMLKEDDLWGKYDHKKFLALKVEMQKRKDVVAAQDAEVEEKMTLEQKAAAEAEAQREEDARLSIAKMRTEWPTGKVFAG